MKIRKVAPNNRKRMFEVHTHRAVYSFPYVVAQPSPSSRDRIERVYVDPELGREGFTFELESGRGGSVHMDSVLEYNKDPSYMADLLLYKLTVEAQRRLQRSRLSKREVMRRLNTSASQLYRLLDPTNDKKSLRQMVALLAVLGYEVNLSVTRSG